MYWGQHEITWEFPGPVREEADFEVTSAFQDVGAYVNPEGEDDVEGVDEVLVRTFGEASDTSHHMRAYNAVRMEGTEKKMSRFRRELCETYVVSGPTRHYLWHLRLHLRLHLRRWGRRHA